MWGHAVRNGQLSTWLLKGTTPRSRSMCPQTHKWTSSTKTSSTGSRTCTFHFINVQTVLQCDEMFGDKIIQYIHTHTCTHAHTHTHTHTHTLTHTHRFYISGPFLEETVI